jgi:hypothetical protein
MKLLIFLFFATASTAHAQGAYESCISRLTQDVLAGTQLNLADAKVVDYGVVTSKTDRFINDDGRWKFVESLGEEVTPQTLRVQGGNGRTNLSFPLEIELFDVKQSEFGSGQSRVDIMCCASANSITVVDLATQQTKKFPVTRNCAALRQELAKNEQVVSISSVTPLLCPAFGKKTESWSSTYNEIPSHLPERIPCPPEDYDPIDPNQICYGNFAPSYKRITKYKGCRMKKVEK